MTIYTKIHQPNTFQKYNLSNESLAATVSGMHKFTDLDKRCITFTIHLQEREAHKILCRHVFDIIEEFVSGLDVKQKSVSHCGLGSFVDVNGTKYSGADRDPNQIHCHGCLFFPHGVLQNHENSILNILKNKISQMPNVVKNSHGAVLFSKFDRNACDATLLDWILYSQKEEVRVDASGTIGVFLPFDVRKTYGEKTASNIVKKRDKVLTELDGRNSFKIFRRTKF